MDGGATAGSHPRRWSAGDCRSGRRPERGLRQVHVVRRCLYIVNMRNKYKDIRLLPAASPRTGTGLSGLRISGQETRRLGRARDSRRPPVHLPPASRAWHRPAIRPSRISRNPLGRPRDRQSGCHGRKMNSVCVLYVRMRVWQERPYKKASKNSTISHKPAERVRCTARISSSTRVSTTPGLDSPRSRRRHRSGRGAGAFARARFPAVAAAFRLAADSRSS